MIVLSILLANAARLGRTMVVGGSYTRLKDPQASSSVRPTPVLPSVVDAPASQFISGANQENDE